MSKFKTLFQNIGFRFSVSAVCMNIFTMLTGILTIKWVSPNDMGIWNSFAIFVTYIYIIQFGIINGLGRELPFFLGMKKKNIAHGLTQTSLFVIRIVTIFTFIIGVIMLKYFSTFKDDQIFFTAISIISLILIQFYNNYLLSTYRSSNSFKKLTSIYFIQSFFIIGSLFLVYFYKYTGHLVRITLIAILQLILLHYFRPYKIKAIFHKKLFSLLIKTGLPLFVLNYLFGIVNTFSRIIILQIGTSLQMGLYSPAIAINTAMKLIPVTLSQYFYPKIAHAAGKGSSPKEIWKYSKKISLLIFIITVPVGIVGYIFLPYIISNFFPEYSDGLYTAQLSVIAGVFAAGSHIFITSLSSLKAIKQLAFLHILRAIVFYSLIYIFALNFSLLEGVGYGLILSEIIFYITAFFICRDYFNNVVDT